MKTTTKRYDAAVHQGIHDRGVRYPGHTPDIRELMWAQRERNRWWRLGQVIAALLFLIAGIMLSVGVLVLL